jgi:hypothetical protein
MARSKKMRVQASDNNHILLERKPRFLSAPQISLIDEVLEEVSPYGEIRLRVDKGGLRFVAQTKSYDALKLQRPEGMREISVGKGK